MIWRHLFLFCFNRWGDRNRDDAESTGCYVSHVCGHPTRFRGKNRADFIYSSAQWKGRECTWASGFFLHSRRRSRGGAFYSRFCILHSRYYSAGVTSVHQRDACKCAADGEFLRPGRRSLHLDWTILEVQRCCCHALHGTWRSCRWRILQFTKTWQARRPIELDRLRS